MPESKKSEKKAAVETVAPTQPADQTPAPSTSEAKPKSKVLLFVVIGVILLICLVVGGVAVYLVLKNTTFTIFTPTPVQTLEPTEAVKTQPDVSQVKDDFDAVESYRIYTEFNVSGQTYSLDGEYQSPNKEHATAEGDEEISIGNFVYYKASGEEWSYVTDANLTGFHDVVFSVLNKLEDYGEEALKGEKDGYWYYTAGDPDVGEGQMEVYVNQKTELPAILRQTKKEVVVTYIEFNDYGDTGIVIEAPL